jgi:hypothetical protein
MAKALIIAWSFCRNSLRNLAGNFGAEFDPEQGIRIPEQGIWRPPGNPNPARLCGAPVARLVGAALARGPRLRRWQAYTALLMMCRSRPRLSLRARPKAQVRPRPAVRRQSLDQFPADGAEENYLYCNPAPNGDKRPRGCTPRSRSRTRHLFPQASLAPRASVLFRFLAWNLNTTTDEKQRLCNSCVSGHHAS